MHTTQPSTIGDIEQIRGALDQLTAAHRAVAAAAAALPVAAITDDGAHRNCGGQLQHHEIGHTRTETMAGPNHIYTRGWQAMSESGEATWLECSNCGGRYREPDVIWD